MPASRRPSSCWLVLLTLNVVLIGCGSSPPEGPQRVAVAGKVTFDGAPLNNAVIRFIPLDGVDGPKASVEIVNGEFEIPAAIGPAAGKHRVEIESTDRGGIAPDDEAALAELAAGKRKPVKPVRIPTVYNTRSTIQQELKADAPNEFTFELVSKR